MIKTNKIAYAGAVHEPANFLARVGITGPVDLTMVNGKVVFENGEFRTIDQERMFAKAEQVCSNAICSENPAYNIF